MEPSKLQLEMGDKFGRTALIHACNGNHPETVQFLLDTGADVSVAYVEALITRLSLSLSLLLSF
jgi:ankyrin repeat protein